MPISARERVSNLSIFTYKVLLVCWLIGSIGFIAKLLIGQSLLATSDGSISTYCDFLLYQMSGTLFCTQPDKIYDGAVQLQTVNALVAPVHLNHVDFCCYPPYFFAFMAPFSFLPLLPAYLTWSVLGAALSLYATYLLTTHSKYIVSKHDRIFFLVGTAVFLPFTQSLQVGYSSQMLLAAIALFVHFWLTNKDFASGFCLAVSAFKYQYFCFLIIPAILFGRWKVAAVALLSVIAFCVLAGLRVGMPNILGYPHYLLTAEPGTNIVQMVNIRGLLSQFLPQSLAMPGSLIGVVFGMLFVALIWKVRQYFSSDLKEQTHWAMAMTIICSLLFGAHVHLSDCTLIAVAAALTMETLDIRKCLQMTDVNLKIWHLILLLSPVASIVLFIWLSTLNHWMSMRLDPFLPYNIAMFVVGSLYFFGRVKQNRSNPDSKVHVLESRHLLREKLSGLLTFEIALLNCTSRREQVDLWRTADLQEY